MDQRKQYPNDRKMKENRRRRQKRRRRRKLKRLLCLFLFFLILCLLIAGVVLMVRAFFFSGEKEKTENTEDSGQKVTSDEEVLPEEEKKSSAVITLLGEEEMQIRLGETFEDPGYKAEDQDGTDLSEQVETDLSGLQRAGEQEVIYRVEGKNGVTAEAVRRVEVLPNTEYETAGLPICMYHYVYDPSNPPANPDSNYISTDNLAAEMEYLSENGYYFPTWQEVRDYVDGRLLLPEKSIVLTFDDGPNYMEPGIPILEKYKTPATSFVIASYWDTKEYLYTYSSDYLRFESHSYMMHQGGGSIGHGGIYTSMSEEEVLDDLRKSFEICGNHDAFAYPFGDYTVEGCATLEEAGLLCAVTTENARCFPGDNPYLLPRVRMLGGQSLEEFISLVN